VTLERTYATGLALRTALEERLKRVAREEGVDLQRLRRQVAFDRFLARLFPVASAEWILKGGYAMGTPVPDSARHQGSRFHRANCTFQ
jgi:hypothetical protein